MGQGKNSAWRRAGRKLLDFVYPPLCVLCREPVADPGGLCPSCWSGIQFVDGPVCERCGLPFEIDAGPGTVCGDCLSDPPAFDKARAVLRYDDLSKKPVLALKHADRLDLVPAFARWLDRAGKPLMAEADLILPVPLHRMRLWHRRYNQSAELARRLAQQSGIVYAPLVLERIKSTPSQGAMTSAKARQSNVRGAFRVPKAQRGAVKARRILVVDDVLTTGATAGACAKALKRAGAASVFVLAVARVVREQSYPV